MSCSRFLTWEKGCMYTLSLNQENLVVTNLRTIQELSVIQRIYRLSQQYAGMNNLFMSQMMVWYIFGKLCKNTWIVKKTCLNDLMRPTGGSVGLPPSAHDSCEGHLISHSCHYHCTNREFLWTTRGARFCKLIHWNWFMAAPTPSQLSRLQSERIKEKVTSSTHAYTSIPLVYYTSCQFTFR